MNLETYLKMNFEANLCSVVLTGLTKAKKRKMLVGRSMKSVSSSFKTPGIGGIKTPNKLGGLNATGGESRLSTVEKMREYEEKRANLKQKYGSRKNNEENGEDNKNDENYLQPDSSNKLGNSIAAMNSSLTEKWRKTNAKGFKGPGGLNNTVGGGFKSSQLQESTGLAKESSENDGDETSKSANTKMALQARLNEVKARLGQINKHKDKR